MTTENGKRMGRPKLPRMSDEWRERLLTAERRRQQLLRDSEEARVALADEIKAAKESGATMSEVAEVLGVNRARAYQLLALASPDEPAWRPLR